MYEISGTKLAAKVVKWAFLRAAGVELGYDDGAESDSDSDSDYDANSDSDDDDDIIEEKAKGNNAHAFSNSGANSGSDFVDSSDENGNDDLLSSPPIQGPQNLPRRFPSRHRWQQAHQKNCVLRSGRFRLAKEPRVYV